MSFSPGPPPPSLSTPSAATPPVNLPARQIPGSYGWPLVGPISDRLDYFWFQKPESFFRKRMEKYKSSVFRTNVPPSFPFFVNVNPNVIAVLDVKSFSHLFDMDLVEKKDVLVGDFVPSTSFTGNIRVGVYQDTSEPQHSQQKNLFSFSLPPRPPPHHSSTASQRLIAVAASVASSAVRLHSHCEQLPRTTARSGVADRNTTSFAVAPTHIPKHQELCHDSLHNHCVSSPSPQRSHARPPSRAPAFNHHAVATAADPPPPPRPLCFSLISVSLL